MSRPISRNPGYSELCGVCGYFPAILWELFTEGQSRSLQSCLGTTASVHSSIPWASKVLHAMRGMKWLLNHQLRRTLIGFNESNRLQFEGSSETASAAVWSWLVLEPAALQDLPHLLLWHTGISVATFSQCSGSG